MEYENFDLRLYEIKDDSYDVEVFNSPEGEGPRAAVEFPVNDKEFADLLSYLRNLYANELDTVVLGQKMRPLLLPGEIWTKFQMCRTATRVKKTGLRIRLRIDSPVLARLPWEYVCDENSRFFAQNIETPLVRYPAESLPRDNLKVDLPIRILLVTANPVDFDQLKVEEEEQLVRDALEPLIATNLAEIEVIRHARVTDVHRALKNKSYHIFHFIGHGGISDDRSMLILEKDNGEGRRVYAQQWWGMVQKSGLKFIFLNACETAVSPSTNTILGMARSLVRAGIPGVLAMQFDVPDLLSMFFTGTLYQSLVAGTPLDQAVTDMRSTTFVTEDMVYWGIPVLYMRAADGVIWQANETIKRSLEDYFSEPELIRWLEAASRRFSVVESELSGEVAQTFTDYFQKCLEVAERDLNRERRQLLKWYLDSLISFLDSFEVTELSTLSALKKARKLLVKVDRHH